ncbi:MAG: nucleoside triphosphate pyrophosphohydrolase [Pseudobdellovibrionaceae bacterium]
MTAPVRTSPSTVSLTDLLDVMARLRDKEAGCPWDIEQNFASIAPYTLEEAYEVADAIARSDMENLKEELGDLLLQVVFHAQMAREENLFDFHDVVSVLHTKLVARHPHVFGDETARSADDVLGIWQNAKDKEKAARQVSEPISILDDIPVNFPSLLRAQKISKRAAKAGFEWEQTEDVIDKVIEELEELRAEIKSGDKDKQQEELGDVFFTLVNLGRRLDLDCEETLRLCVHKFYRRFSGMERDARAQNQDLKGLTSAQWEELWQAQKSREK